MRPKPKHNGPERRSGKDRRVEKDRSWPEHYSKTGRAVTIFPDGPKGGATPIDDRRIIIRREADRRKRNQLFEE